MLHTVNKSPFERSNLDSCLTHALAGSALMLYEDAVYAAVKGTKIEGRMADAAKTLEVFVLEEDMKARGLDLGNVIDGIKTVDYGGFVDLTIEKGTVNAWL